MKKFLIRIKRICKRAVSFLLVLALVFLGFPSGIVSKAVLEQTGLVLNVRAEGELDALKEEYSGHTHTFTSGSSNLSDYSRCFQDAEWAAEHANDTITLNPIESKYIFDENYHPIGNASAAFEGTIYYTTDAAEFAVEANTPIFDYVKDSVKLYQLGTTTVIPLNMKRVANAGDTVSPLLAKHVVGSGAASPYEWKIILNSASVRSYSGVFYEMTDGAKVNLTFTDQSNHTPQLDNNNNITSGSIIDNKESGTNYGSLCGSIKGGSVLRCTYTKTNNDNVTFIGTLNAYCGGLVGELNQSTLEILSGSSDLKLDFQTVKDQVGFICGHAEGSTITLPTGYGISGTIDGNVYAGGIVGYCKNTTVNYETTTGTITLASCTIHNGENASATGGVFGYYECNSAAGDILLTKAFNLSSSCEIESGKGYCGGLVGDYRPSYALSIDLDQYTISDSISLAGTSAGGLFGRLTSAGSVTITDSDTSNPHFVPPASTAAYGAVIGEYVNNSYANTLSLSGFTINNLRYTSSGSVGGVICMLTGASYVSVSGVSVTNVTANDATYFGGIVSKLNDSNAGSFIDVIGSFTLSMASGKTYKGGAIAGSFKKGVIRLAGITDISGAQAKNGYAQLVYENDETLVYAMGNGADSNWTLKRNAATSASDLGQWGEVIRMFKVGTVYKNAEEAGIVSVANHRATIAGVAKDPAISDVVSFAKVALNMQLNDGSNHGALCFAAGGANKTALLQSAISVAGEINLSGTGLLGLMRDGGNGKYIKTDNNSFQGSPDFFTGSITGTTGASTDKILLAVGEVYGCDASGTVLESTANGGRIYLSNGCGHDAQGLISFGKGASFSNLTFGGTMHVSRVAGFEHLYMAPVMGAMTNGATLTNVTVNTTMTADRTPEDAKFFIGGVSGVFDGAETSGNPYSLSVTGSTLTASITLNGSVKGADPSEDSETKTYEQNNTYTGGVLGLLKGSDATQYHVSIATTNVSPIITIGDDVTDNPDYSYIGGMIGRVRNNTSNERSISLNTVTMTGARVDTRAKYPGGLLGAMWDRTNLTVNGLTITGVTVNHKYSGTGSKQCGLVFRGSGKWEINALTMQATSASTPVNTRFLSTDTAPASFGLIVNEAFSENDGLYINLKNSAYSLTGVTVPVSSTNASYCVDEIAADTKNGSDVLVGGNGTGIININMNTANGTKTKITDVSDNTENGTGTYQNRLYEQLGNLVGNRNSRYYYNLDEMVRSGHTKTDGEQFLLWSVSQYAASNIQSSFVGAITEITEIDLSGLSYYPVPVGTVTIPTGATVSFGFQAINDYENASRTPDSWSRNPDDNGNPRTPTARNQHYLMQTGLFTTVSSLTANTLTLTGDFGYVSGAASGALVNQSTSGSVTLTGLTLNNLRPSNADSYLLINSIDGTGTATPSLTLSNLRATNYSTGLPVALSLFGTARGQNMTMNFSNIKLDARDGKSISDSNWTSAAATAMDTAYGTSRSVFRTAIFFTELWAAKSSTMEYYYTVEEDWGTGSEIRKVTYGKEISASMEYPNGEKHYNLVGEGTGHYTNPISDSNTEFNFVAGFLPYVGNYTSKGTNATYPVNEIKVNFKVAGLTEGCGTYNDPYLISTASQLNIVADAVNNGTTPGTIRLPNTMSVASKLPFAATWHSGADGDGLYNLSGSSYVKDDSNSSGLTTWTSALVRNYLASAYYVINADLTGTNSLSSTFEGIGKPGTSVNGNTVFHGVIVGKKSNGSAPTIINQSGNPLIYISNGSVVKNLNISVTANLTRSLSRTGDNALYGYKQNDSTDKGGEYYGGVIGEIMGGDNIIDDVTVTYSGTTTLSGSAAHLIAEGGMVGCVVNGALIFRGSNTVNGRNASGGGIYSNQFVGRVINGYAIYEQINGRSGAAPDNYNKRVVTVVDEEEQVTKTYTYPIDTIDRSNTNKLDVSWSDSTVSVPDAQALYILSLITQSIASTASTSSPYAYYKYSPSYGYNTDSGYQYINGVARLGDYSSVGCGTSAAQPDDYTSYASLDSVNNYTDSSSKDGLMKAPVPYVIYRYTTRYGTTAKNPAADFPARKMTYNNTKFWGITLSSNSTFASMDNYQAFRGIGCAGINSKNVGDTTDKTAFKVSTFNGGGNTIRLHISLPRYRRDQENYYHAQNKSLTQVYNGDTLGAPYGHDGDSNLLKLMGLGLFDCVVVKNDADHEYQFKTFTLQGTVEERVYDSSGNDVTGGKNSDKDSSNKGQSQLFGVGGVYGKRIRSNASDVNFKDITFDDLTISGAYSCGGLVGIDAVKSAQEMRIDGCNSINNGISVTGGYYGESNDLRHGIGSFVGMTFWTRPYINGDDSSTTQVETATIYVSTVTTHYTESNKRCNVGGLIGYSGTGAEIKNINLVGLGDNPTIGAPKVYNTAGFIGFAQRKGDADTSDSLNQAVIIDNCTLNNVSVKAWNSAAGFYGRCNAVAYGPRGIIITNSQIIGNANAKPEIKAYGTGTDNDNNIVGGFVSGFFSTSTANIGVIENCSIIGYKIQGYNVGGMVGRVSQKQMYLKNVYVKDCDIVTHNTEGKVGGFVGYTEQNLSGYNFKIENVSFKHNNNDNTSNAGIISGGNSSEKVYKFVGISAYNSDASKVPTSVVKNNGGNSGNFFVFADYMNTSATDITSEKGYESTFGSLNASDVAQNVTQPVAPYVNTAPHLNVGTNEYLTGDGVGLGATLGNAGEIYKDSSGSSNRKYTVGSTNDPSSGTTDTVTLAKYINSDGTYQNGAFKISTASEVFGDAFTDLGFDNFAMLVINDDVDRAANITPFIKAYIRLVTNAANSKNTNAYAQDAYSCGNEAIDALYQIVIRPCYYSAGSGKFVLGTAGDQGLQMYLGTDTTNHGKYWFDSTKADSESGNTCQFSLIDVQFKDPTDASKIAYHLYVPVYTKKMLTAEFSAVTMSATTYSRSPYANKISSEIAANKTNSILVESTNEWTTTFIRYTYPKSQISSGDNWNFDKSIILNLDNNFGALPNGTKLILVDPNADADCFYSLTLDGSYTTGVDIPLSLTSFRDQSNTPFAPQNLSAILADPGAWGTSEGHTDELYEDYYISIFVPNLSEGQTHSLTIKSGAQMTHTIGSDVQKANIDQKLYSIMILGDLFSHSITTNSFSVTSGDGDNWADNREMTAVSKVLRTDVTATVQIKNQKAGAYLSNTDVYHAYYLTLTSTDMDGKVSDIIYGITPGYVRNTTTISYTNSTGYHSETRTNSYLGANYIYLNSGSIRDALSDLSSTPVVTIRAVTTMTFNDITAFPFNQSGAADIGTQLSVKSSVAYREEDLRFSALNETANDPDGYRYYSTTKNSAQLSFNAVPTDDATDEVGYKTNNRSLLGVNGYYGTQHPIVGKAIYNVDDIVDYSSADYVEYTVSLYKKVTDGSGTAYVQVSDIGDYMSNVILTDSNSEVALTADRSDPRTYKYTGAISHSNPLDLDKMFEVDFNCTVLTGDATHNQYSNYKIVLTADLIGASNAWKDSFLIYTNVKFDPSVIDEAE